MEIDYQKRKKQLLDEQLEQLKEFEEREKKSKKYNHHNHRQQQQNDNHNQGYNVNNENDNNNHNNQLIMMNNNSNNNISKLSIITQPEILYETTHKYADKAASTLLGQYAIDKIDKVLLTIEKTAKWSLPQSEPLDRPLPWIPFLATIVALRALRISLSFASILIGNEPITASSLVYFIQTRRRKLRYIKINGLKTIQKRQQEQQQQQLISQHKYYGVMNKLNSIIETVFCKTGSGGGGDDNSVVNDNSKNSDISVKVSYKKTKKSTTKNNENTNLLTVLKNTAAADKSMTDISISEILYKSYSENCDENDSDYALEEGEEDEEIDEEEEEEEIEDEEEEEGANMKDIDDDNISEEISEETSIELENLEEKINKYLNKSDENKMKNKNILKDIIQKNYFEEIENEIKNKFETHVNERIALALTSTKLNENEIQMDDQEVQQQEQQQQQQQEQQQENEQESQNQKEHQQNENENEILNMNDDKQNENEQKKIVNNDNNDILLNKNHDEYKINNNNNNNNNNKNNNNNNHNTNKDIDEIETMPDNPSSILINRPKMSPKIAQTQNGNIIDDTRIKLDNFMNVQKTELYKEYKEKKGFEKLTINISSDSSSSDDIFYSPEITFDNDKIFDNNLLSSVGTSATTEIMPDVIVHKNLLNPIKSTIPFLENEIQSNKKFQEDLTSSLSSTSAIPSSKIAATQKHNIDG